ncbi:c-type cytochrome [Nitrobacter vulgaris]|uniref:c-type cytochrome n=1 Tax=Nitrobacter vulgaris TaxID=29421 RepID=UPI00286AE929|nr:cytochrome c [Nitrobacter vulgaris]
MDIAFTTEGSGADADHYHYCDFLPSQKIRGESAKSRCRQRVLGSVRPDANGRGDDPTVRANFLCRAADPSNGKDIAERWCASCHLVESGQRNSTDLAPPFTYLAKRPDFDQNKLAFLLLIPHPNMPKLSLNRSEISDLAKYIRSLK